MKPYEKKVHSKYGAPMGRTATLPIDTSDKLYLRRVPMVDGVYDPGGAYWGLPAYLYCAWNSAGRARYCRASNRTAAKKLLPNARFYR